MNNRSIVRSPNVIEGLRASDWLNVKQTFSFEDTIVRINVMTLTCLSRPFDLLEI